MLYFVFELAKSINCFNPNSYKNYLNLIMEYNYYSIKKLNEKNFQLMNNLRKLNNNIFVKNKKGTDADILKHKWKYLWYNFFISF